MSRPALKTRLFGSAALTLMALAALPAVSHAQQPIPPEHYTLDARGVDLVTGTFNYGTSEVVIGQPGAGGLAYGRVFLGSGGWRDTLLGTINASGSTYIVSIGSESEVFTKSGSTYTPVSNNGATLTQSGFAYNFTGASGGVASFFAYGSNIETPYQANVAVLMEYTAPNGEEVNYNYVTVDYCALVNPEGGCDQYGQMARLQSVTNNFGYQIHYGYASDDPESGPFSGGWLTLAGVLGLNAAVDYCDPFGGQCTSLSRTWPSVAYADNTSGNPTSTDEMSRTTTYTVGYAGGLQLTSVRLPGSTSDDVAVGYNTSGQSTSLTDASGAWAYGYSTSGSTRTTTASGPLNQQIVAVSDLAIGRATSVAVATSSSTTSTWNFTYDSQRRLQRTTNPEGDYVEATYDGRGNVTQTTATPKSGSGLSAIVTSASYPSSCSNVVTCNLPTSTTDARGNVTDYTWDSTHGGPLTITEPTPGTGLDRPQTRYTYASFNAYAKNSGGSIVSQSPAVTLPTQVSSCATGTSCTNASNEVRTTVAYGSTGVANNLLPTSISQGSGASPSMVVTAMTYTANGDLETVDGPLSGTDDTTRYRYDNARQMVGAIGPDPDAGGSLLNRAARFTHNARGQVTLVEAGTTPGYSDSDWASFSTLEREETVYGDFGRLIRNMQQSASGTTQTLQQFSYDAAGRPECSTSRMNASQFSSLPLSACTLGTAGSFGPDRVMQMVYDYAGRVSSTTSAYGTSDATTEAVTYTANGMPLVLSDGNGNASTLEYDGFDRTSALRYPNASGGGSSTTDKELYSYDAASNITAFTDRGGNAFAVTYDALNRPTLQDAPSGTNDIQVAYDNLSRPTSIAYPGGQSVTMDWDALSRLTSETTSPLGTVSSLYDPAGRRTRLTWPDSTYINYEYDLYDGLTAVKLSTGTSLASYTRDNLGRRTAISRQNSVTTSFGYDVISRLTSLAHDASGSGQDVSFAFTYNPANQIATRTVSNAAYVYAPVTGSASYANNGRNQVTSAAGSSVGYDTAGNITTLGGVTHSYDARAQLTGVGSATFQFDPVGRLYRSAGGADARFVYDGVQAIAEFDASSAMTRRHVPGAALDETVMTYDGAASLWTLTDERGSVIGLADGSGAVTINAYDEYGAPKSGNAGRFQYTGQMWLPDAGLYHYRARAYAPQLGRFMQTDPAGYGAGANLYAYVGGDPANFVDPMGLSRLPPRTIKVRVDCGATFAEGEEDKEDCYIDVDVNSPFASNQMPIGGGFEPGSGFGWTPPDRPVTDTEEYRQFDAEVDRVSAENAILAEPILWLIPAAPALRGYRALSALRRACNCFVAGTEVMTETGLKAIEEIKVGERVLARDEITGQTAYRSVLSLIDGEEREVWDITVETTDGSGATSRETVGATNEHPWRLVGGAWTETDDLQAGMEIVTADGDRASVVSVIQTERREQTYNFEVDGFHTYFVGESGLLVHNACQLMQRVTNLRFTETIARGRHIRIVRELVDRYGGRTDQWRKMKGIGEIDGRTVEVHWYQNDSLGAFLGKIKYGL